MFPPGEQSGGSDEEEEDHEAVVGDSMVSCSLSDVQTCLISQLPEVVLARPQTTGSGEIRALVEQVKKDLRKQSQRIEHQSHLITIQSQLIARLTAPVDSLEVCPRCFFSGTPANQLRTTGSI
jgi:hypothetical protein